MHHRTHTEARTHDYCSSAADANPALESHCGQEAALAKIAEDGGRIVSLKAPPAADDLFGRVVSIRLVDPKQEPTEEPTEEPMQKKKNKKEKKKKEGA